MKINSILNEYLETFPNEYKRLAQLIELVENFPNDDELISRKNFVGHITASGFVISRSRTKVLLLYHKTLRKFLQPGGHVELGEQSPLDAALREVREETSISTLDYLPFHYFNNDVPIDIDTHPIPENKSKNEPAHWHHDFRYLFLCDDEIEGLTIDENESVEYQWVEINELLRMQTFSVVTGKIQKALSQEFRPKKFYERLVGRIDSERKVGTIVVMHFLPDVFSHLRTLDKVSEIITLIPKPKSIVQNVYDMVQSRFHVQKATRELIQNTDIIAKTIASTDREIILFDIGGYFAPILNDLALVFPGKILGVVEDTENGHQKYESLNSLPLPVYSVARSPLKANEDFLVGQSVLFSADAILRDAGKLIQYLNCSVLGYGKIGNSIAYHLTLRGVKPNVFDTNPVRRLEAYNRVCFTPSRSYIMRNSDVIFCATGNQALNILDFRQLKPGCFIFSVTSSDDEMNLTFLNSEYNAEEVAEYITKYSNFNNHFYLVNKGNAVNFIHKAVMGDFIHLVKGEMIWALNEILTKRPQAGLYELPNEARREIAEIWMNIFVDDDYPFA